MTGVDLTVPTNTSIQAGTQNELFVDLRVRYANTRDATSIAGQSLWTTRLWVSSDQDGSNELPGTVVEEALTEGQQSQDLRKSPSSLFTLTDIRYRFDLTHHTCAEARYICAKFNKGPDPEVEEPRLDYHFQASPSEAVLTVCTEIPECRGKLGAKFDVFFSMGLFISILRNVLALHTHRFPRGHNNDNDDDDEDDDDDDNDNNNNNNNNNSNPRPPASIGTCILQRSWRRTKRV